jgi:iron complex transport system substrate-binding protein
VSVQIDRRNFMTASFSATAVMLGFLPAFAQARFTDDGGRSLALPKRVARILPAGPPASVDLLMVAPRKLVGLTSALTPAEAAFLPSDVASLPVLGRLTGRGNTMNFENVLKMTPDLAIDIGYVGKEFVSLADRVQRQTGVPYALVGGGLAETPATLRKIGELVQERDRAESLARYAEDALRAVQSATAEVPPDQRPRVYMARGPRGLATAVAGSINSEALELAGARNVASPTLGAHGLADVSMDQLLAWAPDTIVALDPAFYASVWSDPVWRTLSAVKAKRVYLAPSAPFGWVDQPPAANRLIGLRWLTWVFYPTKSPVDIRVETRRFYELFYQKEPSEQQLDQLLAGAAPPP